MMRCMVLALSFFCGAHAAHAADGMAYEDNKLNFRNCQGENVTARWFGTKLSLSRAGASPSEPEITIEHVGWDGACMKINWDTDKAEFQTSAEGSQNLSSVVKYVAWDGGKWIATRTGAGFYVSRVAKSEDAGLSKSNFANAAQWLRRRDPNNFGAVTLIDALTKAASTE